MSAPEAVPVFGGPVPHQSRPSLFLQSCRSQPQPPCFCLQALFNIVLAARVMIIIILVIIIVIIVTVRRILLLTTCFRYQ